MSFVCFVLGIILALVILEDAFASIVLPRRISRALRPTRLYYRTVWWICITIADALPAGRIRKGLFGAFGPISVFGLFVFWGVGLIFAFGLLHCATAPPGRGFFECLYLSGTTFTTLGYGDVTPAGSAGRAVSVIEASVGFGFLAVVIGFLPVFYQAFSHRELTIALFDARAGSPPSAGQILLRLPPRKGGALNRLLEETERWSASILESHLSYPVLSFYRSQHDNQSWLAALTCTLDTCALLLTVVEGADRQQARLTFAMARHAVVDLALIFRQPPVPPPDDRLPPEMLDRLLAALQQIGWTVQDTESARKKLIELRGLYEPFAEVLGDFLRLALPPVWQEHGPPDNWQTTAWARRAAGFSSLGADPDDHAE